MERAMHAACRSLLAKVELLTSGTYCLAHQACLNQILLLPIWRRGYSAWPQGIADHSFLPFPLLPGLVHCHPRCGPSPPCSCLPPSRQMCVKKISRLSKRCLVFHFHFPVRGSCLFFMVSDPYETRLLQVVPSIRSFSLLLC